MDGNKNKVKNVTPFFLYIFLILFLLIAGFLFFAKIFHLQPLMTPEVIPSGFERTKTVFLTRTDKGNIYRFDYINSNGEKFTYVLVINSKGLKNCSPPPIDSSFITDYSEFLPNFLTKSIKVDGGCAMTLNNKNDGSKKRVYLWFYGSTRFYIFSENLCISEQEAMDLANSLRARLIFIEENFKIDSIIYDL